MEKAVITGPTGAIGVALINELVQHNIKVYAVCRPESKRLANIPKNPLVTVIACDLDQLGNLSDIINESCDVFYHFGWDGTFGDSRNNMQGQLKNVQYTLDAVEAASRLGCRKFVGAGSQAEYGRVEGKLNSSTPAFPENGTYMDKNFKYIWAV